MIIGQAMLTNADEQVFMESFGGGSGIEIGMDFPLEFGRKLYLVRAGTKVKLLKRVGQDLYLNGAKLEPVAEQEG